MIVDWLVRLAAQFAAFLLSFLPSFAENSLVQSFAAAFQYVVPYWRTADYFVALHEAAVLFLSLFAIRIGIILWTAMNWLYSRLPIIGH